MLILFDWRELHPFTGVLAEIGFTWSTGLRFAVLLGTVQLARGLKEFDVSVLVYESNKDDENDGRPQVGHIQIPLLLFITS
jgi:hypothetical protein